VWINGTHRAGKTTTSPLVQRLIPGSRVFDAEKVGETLMDISPGLPATDNFQHWPPWRSLVVETARQVLKYTGGTLIIPMTVLVEKYWREISSGLAGYGIPVKHVVLHADTGTLRSRIAGDLVLGPNSPFRLKHRSFTPKLPTCDSLRKAGLIDTNRLTADETTECTIKHPAGVTTCGLASFTPRPAKGHRRGGRLHVPVLVVTWVEARGPSFIDCTGTPAVASRERGIPADHRAHIGAAGHA